MSRTGQRRVVIVALLVAYGLALAYLTLWPRPGVSGAIQANWVLGASVRDLLEDGSPRLVVRNLAGNFVLLVPLAGLLVSGLVWTRRTALAVCAGTSVSIELLQASGLFDGRGLNVDDVLLNVTGAGLAVAVAPRRASASGR